MRAGRESRRAGQGSMMRGKARQAGSMAGFSAKSDHNLLTDGQI